MLSELVKNSAPLPLNSKLLILGGGFSGQHIAALVRALGTHVLCSRRRLESHGANLAFDSSKKTLLPNQALEEVTHLLSCIPPDKNGEDPVLSTLGKQLKSKSLQWVGYLSTTGVYGDCNGAWVTELDTPQPKQQRSKRRLACEKAWQESGLPIQILRLPGIYGPGRSALETIKTSSNKMIDKPGQVFSRVHVDDIAGATVHLINLAAKGIWPKVINIADDLPSSNLEVMSFAAKLLGKSLPPVEPFDIAAKTMSPMALSFWQENRRVSNQMLCKELDYSLIHSNYQSGLKDCLVSSN